MWGAQDIPVIANQALEWALWCESDIQVAVLCQADASTMLQGVWPAIILLGSQGSPFCGSYHAIRADCEAPGHR